VDRRNFKRTIASRPTRSNLGKRDLYAKGERRKKVVAPPGPSRGPVTTNRGKKEVLSAEKKGGGAVRWSKKAMAVDGDHGERGERLLQKPEKKKRRLLTMI